MMIPSIMKIKTVVAVVVSILVLALVSPGHSANLVASPSLEVVGAYDSNLFSVQDNVLDDYFLRTTPRLSLTLEMESGALDITGGIDSIWYKDHPDFSNKTASKFAWLTTPVPIRLTTSLSVAPFARYLETNNPYRRLELVPSPTPDEPPTEIVITPLTRQRAETAGLQTTYALSQRFDTELGGAWERIEFPNSEGGLVGSKTLRGDASLLYKGSPLLTPGIYARVRETEIEDGRNELAYTGGLRGSYVPVPNYILDGRVGVTWLKTTSDNTTAKNEELSPEAILNLTYTKIYFHATLQASYIFEGGGLFGTPRKRGTIYAAVGDRITERWSWDFVPYYQNIRSTDNPRTIQIDVVDGTATITYEPLTWMSFHLSGNVHRQLSSGLIGEDIDRYRVVVGFSIRDRKKIL